MCISRLTPGAVSQLTRAGRSGPVAKFTLKDFRASGCASSTLSMSSGVRSSDGGGDNALGGVA
ncbi:hypothetical protein FHS96_005663 [Sphingomonas zeicaulis]|uniref:hypothetical protein n=1 Tax=Sphingomonas zeicaulis TaxID=1632740 RepID=UPI003D238ADB